MIIHCPACIMSDHICIGEEVEDPQALKEEIQRLNATVERLEDKACWCDPMIGWTCDVH